MKNDSIVILGLEGSGKTVFTSVFVNSLNRATFPRIGFGSKEASIYVDKNMSDLNNGIWPASTLTGNLEKMDFVFELDSSKNITMSLFDLAGQDIREIFWDNDLDERLLPIKKQIDQSRHILFTVDILAMIRNYQNGANHRKENFLIKDILDKLPKRKVLVVFTKINDKDLVTHVEKLAEVAPDFYLLLQRKKFNYCAIRCLDEKIHYGASGSYTKPVLDKSVNKSLDLLIKHLTDGMFGFDGLINDAKETLISASEFLWEKTVIATTKSAQLTAKTTEACWNHVVNATEQAKNWTMSWIKR